MLKETSQKISKAISRRDVPQLKELFDGMTTFELDNKSRLRASLSGIGNKGVQCISKALMNNKTVKTLKLLYQNIGLAGTKDLAKLLMNNQTLTVLELAYNIIGSDGTKELARALRANKTLKTLGLTNNNIGSAGIKELINSLRKNQTLNVLSLACNNIGATGTKELIPFLKNNRTFFYLRLSHNNFGPTGFTQIMKGFEMNHILTYLYIHTMKADNDVAKSIIHLLEINHTLTYLDVRNNKIDDAGAKKLIPVLEKNYTLISFNLAMNKINAELLARINSLIERNQKLKNTCLQAAKEENIEEVVRLVASGASIGGGLVKMEDSEVLRSVLFFMMKHSHSCSTATYFKFAKLCHTLKNSDGLTPFDIAEKHNNKEIIKLAQLPLQEINFTQAWMTWRANNFNNMHQLDLSRSMISEKLLNILSALVEVCSIQSLNLSNNYINYNKAFRIIELLQGSYMLKELNLSYNIISADKDDLTNLIELANPKVTIDISQNYVACTHGNTDSYLKQNQQHNRGSFQIMPVAIDLNVLRIPLEEYQKQLQHGNEVAIICVMEGNKALGHIFINFEQQPAMVSYNIENLSHDSWLWDTLRKMGARQLKKQVRSNTNIEACVEKELIAYKIGVHTVETERGANTMKVDGVLLKKHLIQFRMDRFKNRPAKHLLLANLQVNHGIFRSDNRVVRSHIDPSFEISREQCVIYLACKRDNQEHAMLLIEGMRSFGQLYLQMAHFGPQKGVSGSKANGIKDIFGKGTVTTKLYDIESILRNIRRGEGYILAGWPVPRRSERLKTWGIQRLQKKIVQEEKDPPPYFKLDSNLLKPLKFFGASAQSQVKQSHNCLTWALAKLELLGIEVNKNLITTTFPRTHQVIQKQKDVDNQKCLVM